MKKQDLQKIIREELHKVISESKTSKTTLKEGYAWERSERKFGDPLPTLASVQKAHQAKQSVLKEVMAPSFKAKHKNNNLVAAIYFSWKKAENNTPSLWTKVIELVEGQDCKLVNYVVTDSVCEFEFKPNSPAIDQDLLDKARIKVESALKPLKTQCEGYDVYIVGN
jgi:hypothetical protein